MLCINVFLENGLETKFHKIVTSVDVCKRACAKTKYCAAAYYIKKHKLCSLRLCQFRHDKTVAKPSDKSFLTCGHKPCTGKLNFNNLIRRSLLKILQSIHSHLLSIGGPLISRAALIPLNNQDDINIGCVWRRGTFERLDE
jgi:hypothetical protein